MTLKKIKISLKALRLLLALCLAFSMLAAGLQRSEDKAWTDTCYINGDGAQCVVDIYKGQTKIKQFSEPTFRTNLPNKAEAYCVDFNKVFKAGTFTSQDPLKYMGYDTLNKIMCAKQELVFGSLKPTDNYTKNYTLAQCVIWSILRDDGGQTSADTRFEASNSGVSSTTAYSNFKTWYSQNGWKYKPSEATYWSNGSNTQPVITGSIAYNIGNLEITKTSANPDITNGNSCYSLEGAVYQLKQGEEVKATLTTNADGWARAEELIAGDYELVEVQAPKGYALNSGSTPVHITGGETTYKHGNDGGVLQDRPQNDPVGILLGKFDGQKTYNGEANLPQGSATLEGAEFTVKYYDGQYSTAQECEQHSAVRTWVLRTNQYGYCDLFNEFKIAGDEFYYKGSSPCIPLGTCLIYESKAPTGYLINNEKFARNITTNGSSVETVNTYNMPTVSETVKRGDLEFVKCAEDKQTRLKNIAFRLSSNTTGESHVLLTDDNGEARTSSSFNLHSQNTNANDNAFDENGLFDPEKGNILAGVWFGDNHGGNMLAVNDNMGALPYDTYTLEELRCPNNEGLELIKLENIVISRENYSVNLGTLDNQTTLKPSLTTHVREKETYGQVVSHLLKKATIIDKVDYQNLDVNKYYKLIGTIIDKTTGEPYQTKDGKTYTATKMFKTDDTCTWGYAENEFEINPKEMQGKEFVVFEELYKIEDGVEVKVDEKTGEIELLDLNTENETQDDDGVSDWEDNELDSDFTLKQTLVCEHKDKDDFNQTFRVSAPDEETPQDEITENANEEDNLPNTGDKVTKALLILLASVILSFAVAYVVTNVYSKTNKTSQTSKVEIKQGENQEK